MATVSVKKQRDSTCHSQGATYCVEDGLQTHKIIFLGCLGVQCKRSIGMFAASPDYKAPPIIEQARQNILQADAIVDGKIVRLGGYDYRAKKPIPVILKVSKVFKGPRLSSFSLRIPAGGCEISFHRKEKVRLLLSEANGSWAAIEHLNLPYPIFGEASEGMIDYRLPYARALDEQIGFPRSPDTAFTLAGQ